MLIRDTMTMALRAMTANKARALLTMLGIIIGVGAVVLMTGVGKSMEGVILGQISTLGPKSMALWPGNQGPEGGPTSARADFDAITLGDIDALSTLQMVRNVAPQIFVSGDVSYGTEISQSQVIGTTPAFFLNQDIKIQYGRLLDDSDERAGRAAAVLGVDTVEDLFFDENPLNKRIRVGSRSFEVVGVLEPIGTQFFQNADERIVIPFSTAQAITGQNYVNMVTAEAVDDFDSAFADIRSLLRQRHRIVTDAGPLEESDEDDFLMRSSAQAQEILSAVSLGLTLFITTVAAISLVVGGIGIMNIMLVAVTERTREIGLRKALGARRRDILLQFIVEAVMLTMVGGMIGSFFGIGFAFIAAEITNRFLEQYQFALSFPAIIIAFMMAAGTGLVFGIYPAKQAASLDPIDALRYE